MASAKVGAKCAAWDGYITGENLELDRPTLIVRSWRSSEFPAGVIDSRLEVMLEEAEGEMKVTLRHSEIPDGRSESYKSGWVGHQFEPMKAHFGG